MHEDSTEEEEMKPQRRMNIMKDMTAENRWCFAELLAADCEKAWLQERKKPCKHGLLGWRK